MSDLWNSKIYNYGIEISDEKWFWLFDFIYNKRNAFFSPDPQKVQSNIDNNDRENLRYFGTYFPRTCVEFYSILQSLCALKKIKENFLNSKEIRILSIGTGTGGELIGILIYLAELFINCPPNSEDFINYLDRQIFKIINDFPTINIECIEPNSGAVKIASETIKEFCKKSN